MVTESLTESAPTLEPDEESVLSGNKITELDFLSSVPISAAVSIDIIGTHEESTQVEQFPVYRDSTQTPSVSYDGEPETNPSRGGKNTFYPFPDEKFLLYCYSHGIMRPKVRKMTASRFLFYLFNIKSPLPDNVRPSLYNFAR